MFKIFNWVFRFHRFLVLFVFSTLMGGIRLAIVLSVLFVCFLCLFDSCLYCLFSGFIASFMTLLVACLLAFLLAFLCSVRVG